jgi:hypothetical protein
MTEIDALDPCSANVSFEYLNYGSDEESRRYYWYDPAGGGGSAWDDELRDQYPAIPQGTWDGLFAAAFRRGELEFLKQFSREQRQGHGELLLLLGYHFGPYRSTEIARHSPEFQYFLDPLELGDEPCRRPNRFALIRSCSRSTGRRMRVWWKSQIKLVKETGRRALARGANRRRHRRKRRGTWPRS